jgi:curved DNA-binding protein CbpA
VTQQDRATSNNGEVRKSAQKAFAESHYALLGLHPSAPVREIRQAYRDLSKLYHPDTTTLPTEIATAKFQKLNEAYATLSSPERRRAYDLTIGYSSIPVVQVPLPLNRSSTRNSGYQSSSAYLDATDRPLSPGEIFALFILGITFLCCLFLAIAIGLTRGESLLPSTIGQEQREQPAQVSRPSPSKPVAPLPQKPSLPSVRKPGPQAAETIPPRPQTAPPIRPASPPVHSPASATPDRSQAASSVS